MRTIAVAVLLASPLALGACTGTPTQALTLEAIAPTTETPEIAGARRDGAYPEIGRQPVAQTQQLTAAEKREIRTDLTPAVKRSLATDPKAAASAHKREVEDMNKLLDYHAKRKAEPDYE